MPWSNVVKPTTDLISLRDYFCAIETKQSLKVRMKKVRRRERDRQRGLEREREINESDFFKGVSGRFEPTPQPSRENLECYP